MKTKAQSPNWASLAVREQSSDFQRLVFREEDLAQNILRILIHNSKYAFSDRYP